MKNCFEIGLVCVVLIIFAGCNQEPTKKVSDATTQGNTESAKKAVVEYSAESMSESSSDSAAKASAKYVESAGSKAAQSQRDDSVKWLSIDELLQREDLVFLVQNELSTYRSKGMERIKESAFLTLVDQFDIDVTIKNRIEQGWTPTQAASSTKLIEEVSDRKILQETFINELIDFGKIGIQHFETLEISGLNDETQKEVAAWMDRTVTGVVTEHSGESWEDMLAEVAEIRRKVPALEKDAMFQYCLAGIHFKIADFVQSQMCYKKSTTFFRYSDYPARAALMAHERLVHGQDNLIESRTRVRDVAYYFLTIDYWLKNDFRAKPDELRYAYIRICRFISWCDNNNEWELLERFMDSFADQDHLPVWLHEVIYGECCYELAWRYRGGGFAHTVTEEGWTQFEKYMKLANGHMARAYDENPNFPEAASALIGICKAGHAERTTEHWFDEAIEAQKDYLPAYYGMMHSLLPQWGGSVDEMFEFAETYSADIPFCMVMFNSMVQEYTRVSDRQKLNDIEVVDKTIQAIDEYLERDDVVLLHQAFRDRNYFLTVKAIIASRAELYDVAREAFDEVGENYDSGALRYLKVPTYALIRGKTYALSGDKADEVAELLQKVREHGEDGGEKDVEIVDTCSELMSELGSGEGASWLKMIRDRIEFKVKYTRGEFAKLPFDKNLYLWTYTDRSQIKFESEDSIEIDNRGPVRNFNLSSILRSGDSKIVEFSIEFPGEKSPHRESNHFTPSAVAMLHRDSNFSFGLNRLYSNKSSRPSHVYDMGQFSFGYYNSMSGLNFYRTEIKEGPNQVVLKIAPSYFEAYLNDRFVCRSTADGIQGALKGFRISQPVSRMGRGVAKVSGIRLQEWKDQVPPIRGSDEELIKHYRELSAANPEDKWLAFWHAQAVHKSGSLEEAIKIYRRAIELGMPESEVAFFIGDCLERTGNLADAIRQYVISSDIKTENVTEMFSRVGYGRYSNSNHWAAFRLSWLWCTSPNKEVDKLLRGFKPVRADLPHDCQWANDLLRAHQLAESGKMKQATAMARNTLGRCEKDLKPVVGKIIKAFESGKRFTEAKDEDAFYLMFERPIPFFRCFEDSLPASWKGTY